MNGIIFFIVYTMLLELLIILVCVALLMVMRPKIKTFIGGARDIIISDREGRLPELVSYIDDVTGMQNKYYTKWQKYKDWNSNEQIRTVLRHGTVDEQSRLYRLLGRYLPGNVARAFAGHVDRADRYVYNEICRHFKRNNTGRDRAQAIELYRIIRKLGATYNIKFTDYLDLGCGDGGITSELRLLIGAENTQCAEVVAHERPGIVYSILDPNNARLPYPDNSFDAITAIMSLHHVKDLPAMIGELGRIIRPNGYLLIKEHDVWNAFDAMLVDIEHAIFVHCIDKREPEAHDMPRHYLNYKGWDEIICSRGLFEFCTGGFFYTSIRNEISSTRAFYSLYRGRGTGASP